MMTGLSWWPLSTLLVMTFIGATASAPRKDSDLGPSFGGCAEAGLCCQGKNNTCRVKQHHSNIPSAENDGDNSVMVVARRNRCFCDSACVELADCCHDYKRTCARKLTSFVHGLTSKQRLY